jgi:hypothetical protein
MLIMSYIAIGLWTLLAFISVLIFLVTFGSSISSLSIAGSVFAIIGLLINGFIVYAGYKNIIDISNCKDLLNSK